eukprot:c34856_g1_i1 orf=302-472(+)
MLYSQCLSADKLFLTGNSTIAHNHGSKHTQQVLPTKKLSTKNMANCHLQQSFSVTI